MKSIIIGMLLVSSIGCSAGYVMVVPRTPEAMSCVRECMVYKELCYGARKQHHGIVSNDDMQNSFHNFGVSVGNLATKQDCNHQYDNCFMTCPGAFIQKE